MADILIRAKGFGFGGDPWVPEINKEAWDRLGFSMEDLEEVVFRIGEEVFNVDGMNWREDKQD